VVYAKRPFGGPEAVLAYLARYTHRVAIARWTALGIGPPRFLPPGARTVWDLKLGDDEDQNAIPPTTLAALMPILDR